MEQPRVINLVCAPARSHPRRAAIVELEPAGTHWPDTGVNVRVMKPGQPSGRFHAEPVEENFLVLRGECLAILGDTEQRLRQWDFLHCPVGLGHVFVGAGERDCAVLMVGSRRVEAPTYPPSAPAAKYGASVGAPTDDAAVAYADWRQEAWKSIPSPWPLDG